MIEIIWHGRGGQGVVVASQILAEAAHDEGYLGVTSAPTFGPERRGAPLTASTRISRDPIRTFSQIEQADIVVVLDPSLFEVVCILDCLKPDGLLVVNTHGTQDLPSFPGPLRVATVNAAAIAQKHYLLKEGKPLVNAPMLGALARASGLVSVESLERAVKTKLGGGAAVANATALRDAYEETLLPRDPLTHQEG